MSSIKKFGFLLLIALIAIVSYQAGVFVEHEKNLQAPPFQIVNEEEGAVTGIDFSIFWEAWHQLEGHFLEQDKIKAQEMVYGAIRGLVKSLDDPYTVFFNPKETESFAEEMSGEYQGVGMVVGMKDNQLTVISPFKATPADRAGLKPGDRILEVDETPTRDMAIEEAVALIKGQEGTKVKLLIARESWQETKTIELERAVITIPTLEWELRKQGAVAVIKIYRFNEILPGKFQKAAIDILSTQAEAVVLDLRNNPGGYLEVAQDIAGWFLEKGEVVVVQKGTDKEEVYKSKGPSNFAQYPVVVLINKGSASGSEILAGALRDNRGVKLVGETTFGKGSVQEQLPLSGGASLKITVAKWFTPAGEQISDKGLTPDVEIELTEEAENGEDAQLEKAIEVLNKQL